MEVVKSVCSGGSRISRWGGAPTRFGGGAPTSDAYTFRQKRMRKQKKLILLRGGARRRCPLDPPMVWLQVCHQAYNSAISRATESDIAMYMCFDRWERAVTDKARLFNLLDYVSRLSEKLVFQKEEGWGFCPIPWRKYVLVLSSSLKINIDLKTLLDFRKPCKNYNRICVHVNFFSLSPSKKIQLV